MAITKATDSFILGKDLYPDWFKKLSESGRIVYRTDQQSGELLGVTIATATKVYEANAGDTIMNLFSGVVVVPQTDAKKYGVQLKEE